MTGYVFVGPTSVPSEVREASGLVFLPPAAQGDIYRMVQGGAQAIGLIDGYFEGVPAVWHKEILWALVEGVAVFGSASMGALRAAELCDFGMRGVGRIFESYLSGVLEDDDEVAVLHGPAETGYVAVSEPMVNIRATLDRAVATDVITATSGAMLESFAKELFYKERQWEAVFSAATAAGVPSTELAALRDWLPKGHVDQKAEDAHAMLEAMTEWMKSGPQTTEVGFEFEWTDAWETAIAISRTVGLDPARQRDAVSPDRLLDELRLDGTAYRAATTAAEARLLGLRAADRQRIKVNRRAVSDAFGRLRDELGLLNRVDIERWLAANDLQVEDLQRLMEDETRLEAYRASVEPAHDRTLLDHLRISDAYARLADRARRKHAVLCSLDMPDPRPEDLGLVPAQLLLWYFEERLGRAIPDDLDSYARGLGFADRAAFYRMLARERLFLLSEVGLADNIG